MKAIEEFGEIESSVQKFQKNVKTRHFCWLIHRLSRTFRSILYYVRLITKGEEITFMYKTKNKWFHLIFFYSINETAIWRPWTCSASIPIWDHCKFLWAEWSSISSSSSSSTCWCSLPLDAVWISCYGTTPIWNEKCATHYLTEVLISITTEKLVFSGVDLRSMSVAPKTHKQITNGYFCFCFCFYFIFSISKQLIWNVAITFLGQFWSGRSGVVRIDWYQRLHPLLGASHVWLLFNDKHHCAIEHAHCHDV